MVRSWQWLMVAVLLLAGVARPLFADSLAEVSSAQDKLDYTLNTLKESVARLSDENKKLSAGNEQLKLKLAPMNDRLNQEQSREAKLVAQRDALDADYRKSLAARAALQGLFDQGAADLAGFNASRLAAEDALKARDVENAALAARAEALTRELEDIRTGLVPGEDHTAELEALRVAQQSAQKDLEMFTAQLDRLRAEWKELAVFINAGPGQVDVLKQEQSTLQADIVRRTQEVEDLRQKAASAVKEADDVSARFSAEALALTERDVQLLEAKVLAAEQEAAEAEKTARSGKVSPAQDAKLKKDETRFKDLMQRNKDLVMGLKNLQRSMVSMDKKKSALEKELEQNRSY
ncbi:MAG: hypothetical protein WCO69_05110 [Candidatus Omnitrophota bacterium]